MKKGDLLGEISNPYGKDTVKVYATNTGIIIGMTLSPLVNSGNALFHIARFEDSSAVEEELVDYDEALDI